MITLLDQPRPPVWATSRSPFGPRQTARIDSTPGVRWIICLNPAEAAKDKATRDQAITRLEADLQQIAQARAKATAALKTATSATARACLDAELAGPHPI